MTDFTNVGAAFPLEKIGSDIARNEFNYQAILNGLIAWDKTTNDTITIRLTKDTDPYYEDYVIPSKSAVFDLSAIECDISGVVPYNGFSINCVLNSAIYGGGYTFEEGFFNAETDVSVANNEVTLVDASGFFTQDVVLFESDGTLFTTSEDDPEDIINKQYIIKTKVGNVLTFYENDNITDVDITAVGSGLVKLVKVENQPTQDSTDPGDIATVRVTVNNPGNAEWELDYFQKIYEWESGGTYKYGSLVSHNNIIYKVLTNVSGLTTTPEMDNAHYETKIKVWTEIVGDAVNEGDLVSYDGNLYRAIAEINASRDVTDAGEDSEVTPELGIERNIYELYATAYVPGENYNYGGEYVFYDGSPYIALQSIINSEIAPPDDTEAWELAVILPVPVSGTIRESTVIKWYAGVDSSKFIMRNISDNGDPSESTTDINLKLSIRTKEPASIYQKSVDILSTSNYAYWPSDQTTIWDVAKTITNGNDDGKDISERQDYSAVMVFDHSNASLAKTVNYLNYDGPDLDQGLCIYLPIEVPVGESCIAAPEDGFTYEFFFRIWPNTELTDDLTRDHIINKSHIYVYSAPTLADVQDNTCGTPIAKFSMARTTNFYVFGENIAIPDKPVCYRATFIFSEIENKWITLDYYQLPDHIFMGPVGFIDPRNPSNLDINRSVIGDINPNAAHVGYETGAFPLYQDPFSNPDLSPFRISDDSAYDSFRNRLS